MIMAVTWGRRSTIRAMGMMIDSIRFITVRGEPVEPQLLAFDKLRLNDLIR